MIDEEIKKRIMVFQKNEITEHHIYEMLAKKMKGKNAEVLKKISMDEKETL